MFSSRQLIMVLDFCLDFFSPTSKLLSYLGDAHIVEFWWETAASPTSGIEGVDTPSPHLWLVGYSHVTWA